MKKILVGLATASLIYSVANAKTLSIGSPAEVQSMDPYFINNDDTNSVLGNIFDSLIMFDKDLKIKPGWATSWLNPKPKEWILKLREDVEVHNGDLFKAAYVIVS